MLVIKIFSVGALGTVYGAWLGIPSNYLYESADDIDRSNIIVREEKVDWDSKPGKLLEEALVLTKEEQIFGMSNGILEMNSSKYIYDSLIPAGVALTVYTGAQYINTRENLYIRPPFVS